MKPRMEADTKKCRWPRYCVICGGVRFRVESTRRVKGGEIVRRRICKDCGKFAFATRESATYYV
jgi:transcriptional regulator NrdR family protein